MIDQIFTQVAGILQLDFEMVLVQLVSVVGSDKPNEFELRSITIPKISKV